MTDVRFDTQEDIGNDCLTIIDNQDQVKTSFGSDIILAPLEDASILVRELNIQCAVNQALIEQLENYLDIDDIMYMIDETMEEL